MSVRRITKQSKAEKFGKGITLVEMVVVLVIMAILASAGIGSAVGYVKRSTITQNDSNALTVYQAAQTALQQMEKAGGIFTPSSGSTVTADTWIRDLIDKGTKYPFSASGSNLSPAMSANSTYFTKSYNDTDGVFSNFKAKDADANESVHMRYLLTFSKNNSDAQSTLVKELLQPYFYDSGSVFQGSITLEFDVEKSADSYGKLHHSAKCLSVFFDSRAASGWADKILSGDYVPNRSDAYRSQTSLVGYYDGYKGSTVDTVYLPKIQEGIVVKKLAADYIWQTEKITNAENVEEEVEKHHTWISWAATLDKKNLLGSKKDVYYRLALLNGDNVSKVLLLNEDFLMSDDTVGNSKHSIDFLNALKNKNNDDDFTEAPSGTKPKVTVDTYPVVYNPSSSTEKFTEDITKKSITVMARVFIKSTDNDGYKGSSAIDITSNTDGNLLPLKITYVTNEYDSKHQKKADYIEYSLDISELLEDGTSGVRLTIYPNYFSNDSMKNLNDATGIISFKRGADSGIDPTPTPTPTPVPAQQPTP